METYVEMVRRWMRGDAVTGVELRGLLTYLESVEGEPSPAVPAGAVGPEAPSGPSAEQHAPPQEPKSMVEAIANAIARKLQERPYVRHD